jgi:hydrogenase maturation protein HypF
VTVGRRIEVRGSVQGVGFRPWVWRLARELAIGGRVWNDASGVIVEVFGPQAALDALLDRMSREHPPAAKVLELRSTEIPAEDCPEFTILHSEGGGARRASIPPDLATCEACLREVFDPADRRYRYSFTNCTDCGPRFTIAWDIPYDRPATSMAKFPMCAACQREYDDPADRRFHAQPNACPECGPRLTWLDAAGRLDPSADALATAIEALRSGRVVAVKGLGGFHLACDATDLQAVEALRARKHREDKPFAVMVLDLAAARELAEVNPAAEAALTGSERPIVLLPWKDGHRGPLGAAVAPNAPRVGLFLPYTPLHHLLLRGVGRPLVMTSGNPSGEPIAHTAELAVQTLAGLADGYLTHDRDITTRTDDSVVAMVGGAPLLLRRSRGFVPRPIQVPFAFREPVLAVGGDLKNVCAIGLADEVWLGPHVGDVETEAGWDALGTAVERMERFLGVKPQIVAHDLHPSYHSTRWAQEHHGVLKVGVQHHHAHVAGALAALGLQRGIGVAYDGTGYGADGSAWGGEVLLVDGAHFERLATWRAIALPGGERAIHEPWRVALAWLLDAFDGQPPEVAVLAAIPGSVLRAVRQQLEIGLQCPPAHGLGRRFDAVAALVFNQPRATFEGQLAIAWEGALVGPPAHEPYPYTIDTTRTPWEVDDRPLLRAVVADLVAGVPASVISDRFHAAVVDATRALLAEIRRAHPLPAVLSGGCFANARLVESLVGVVQDLHLPRQVPPGDGGLALGQAVVARGG